MPAAVGDIFKFQSNKAFGHDARDKFHVVIELSEGALLFINSDPFEGAMRIDRTDWPEMPKIESYISCSAAIRYNKQDLSGVTVHASGRLSDDCLKRLEAHVASSITLPQNDIDTILKALAPFASN